jgi:predicted DCC family thiol-disulfide oxidoreductase YuxK
MSSSTSTLKPTVIYDGECRFCIQRVKELQNRDSQRLFDYLPRQDAQAEERFPQISGIKLDDGILLVKPGDTNVYVAADAIYQIFHELPGFKSVAWLYLVPGLRQIFQLGYKLVAMNRRRLGRVCDDNSCNWRND